MLSNYDVHPRCVRAHSLAAAVVVLLTACTQATSGPAETETLSGTVTGSGIGPLAGATVTATPSGQTPLSTTTASDGTYSLSGVPVGLGTIVLSNVPTNCTPPATANYTVEANATNIVNFQINCTASNATEGFLLFNGTTSYAEVPSASQLSVSAAGLTVAVWMRPDVLTFPSTEGSLADQQYVHWLGKGETTAQDQEWTFRMYSQTNPAGPRANRISFYVFNANGGLGCGSYFQDSITPGQWIHVVGAIDAVAQTVSIYKNGQLRYTDSYAGTITPTAGAAPMRIGTRDFNSYFEGAIGPVRVWNRPLAASEVAALFAGNTVPDSGLVAAYAMTEGQGSTIVDSIASNNGTLNNTTWGVGPRQPQSTATGTSGGGC